MNGFEPLLLRVPFAEPRRSIAIYSQFRIFEQMERKSFGPRRGREVNRSIDFFQILNRHVAQPKDSIAELREQQRRMPVVGVYEHGVGIRPIGGIERQLSAGRAHCDEVDGRDSKLALYQVSDANLESSVK